jgi:hypothetical protein
MAIWKEFEGWTYEYFDRDIEPAALPGFEDLVRLWQDRRGDRVVPSWSDFDFYDFRGWHGRLGVHEISYDPFDYIFRLSGTETRVEHPLSMEFYEMTCRQMLIARTSGPVNLKGREHIGIIFVDFPLSHDGRRATHTFEALLSPIEALLSRGTT